METSRRNVLGASAAMTAMLAASACSKAEEPQDEGEAAAGAMGNKLPYEGPEGGMRIYHVWADEDGESHIRTVYATNLPKPLPIKGVVASNRSSGVEDWHPSPGKTFVINTRGDIEGEASDGTKQKIGVGDLVFLEDAEGKGHITRLLTEVSALFIPMPDDFDFEAWLSGPAGEGGFSSSGD